MTNQTLSSDLAIINRLASLCSYAIVGQGVILLIALCYGTTISGHLPQYGIDGDPYSLDSSMFGVIQIVHLLLFMVNFVACPVWLFLFIYLLVVNRQSVMLNRMDGGGSNVSPCFGFTDGSDISVCFGKIGWSVSIRASLSSSWMQEVAITITIKAMEAIRTRKLF